VAEPVNDKIYIHELIDVIGHNRNRYMHHMTANWCPVAREERNQLCFGVWATVGSTGRWPEVVNLWELDGWDGLAANFEHEFAGGRSQDPSLAEWWSVAAGLRRGGEDRIVVPAPWTLTIDELCTEGVRGELYAHEIVSLAPGAADEYLGAVEEVKVDAYAEFGLSILAAFKTAMRSESEAILIWAIPTWQEWAEFERAVLGPEPEVRWDDTGAAFSALTLRTLLVDAPLAPLRTGRQPRVEDRRTLDEV
jgi:hypothetical protein